MKRSLLALGHVTALLFAAALPAAESFPTLVNTNTVNNGTGAPPISAEEAVAQMRSMPPGFKATVFASEPSVQNPVQINWDSRGRLWVAENYTYESDRFVETYSDRIVFFEGADGNGKFTKRTVFADNLKRMLGFAVGHGGVWVMAIPNILFIPDRNSDGVADGPPVVVFDGFNAEGDNMHTAANGLTFGIDGWIYGRTGHAHLQMVGPPGTPLAQRARLHGTIFRFHPETKVIEALGSGATNTYGQDWDKNGEHFFATTVVGPYMYDMPGGKYVSSSGEPNLKAYEVIEQIADFNFRAPRGGGAGGGGGRQGGRGAGAATGGAAAQAPLVPPAAQGGAVAQAPATAPTPAPAAAPAAAAGRGASPGPNANQPWAQGPWANGHAVTGMMIYQGNNWPSEYRDRLYALNLFGHRVVAQTLERNGSGFVARRAPEPDLFEVPDPWFRGIDITYGPDGGVFIADWTDTGDYHNRTGSNRLSGRIYKITYGDPLPSGGSDLYPMTVAQLVALNTHINEWFPRAARIEFSNRMVDGRGVGNARELLREQFTRATDPAHKLRALLTLAMIKGADDAFLTSLLHAPDEAIRVWAIRLLTERWPIDALHTNDVIPPGAEGRRGGGPGVRYIQQRPAVAVGGREVTPTPAILTEFARLAAQDPSSLVRLALASALQRIPLNQRPTVAAPLLAHKEDATDRNLPLMVWYALIPLGEKNPTALAALGTKSELRSTSKYIARRLAEDINTSAGPVNDLVAAATNRDEDYQTDIIDGLTQGLQGQRGVKLPVAWEAFSTKLALSSNAALVAKVRSLDVALGSPRALADAKKIVLDASATPDARKTALQSMLDARAPDLRQVAEQTLAVKTVNAVSATALATFNEPAIGPMLVAAYPQFDAKDRSQLIAALTSRAAYVNDLLDALASGKIPHTAVSATDARQIRSLNNAALSKRLGEIWGEVRETPAAKQELMAQYIAELTAAPGRGGGGGRGGRGGGNNDAAAPAAGGPAVPNLVLADRSAGRAIFNTTCAACHTLFGEGGKIGPDITGGQKRRSLDTLLTKLVFPSSELPLESRMTILQLKDGRTVGGMVTNRTASTISLRMTGDPTTVALSDIASTELAPYSLMPEGLLEGLDATQRRNLIAYLMGDEQAPLPATPAP